MAARRPSALISGWPSPLPKVSHRSDGGSVATSELSDEGFLPNGLRARTVMSQYTFFDRVFVKGNRRRYGAEIDVTHGPVGVRGG